LPPLATPSLLVSADERIELIYSSTLHSYTHTLYTDGRIGLIDYGQTKRFSDDDRIGMALTYACIHRKDKEMLRKLAKAGGHKSKHFDIEVIYKMTQFTLDQDGKTVTGDMNIQQFIDSCYEKDPWTQTADNVIMPTRLSFMLRGIGLTLNHPVSVAASWGPLAEQVLIDEGRPYESWTEEMLYENAAASKAQRDAVADELVWTWEVLAATAAQRVRTLAGL
jgi:predicted unusual protein kinase regulating ubiquinone biosynthesis (AarF/ABC1/UbiB family)